VLWRRRDALPDVYPDAGGVATPIVEGVLGMRIQAFDGLDWRDEWDSDYDGLPLGLRMTLWTSGHRELESAYERQPLELMSTIAIDRVEPPFDHKLLALDALFAELEAERAEEQAVEAAGAADEVDRALNDGAGGSRSRAVRPDGQRRPTGRQRGNTRQPNSRGGSGAADTIREGPPS